MSEALFGLGGLRCYVAGRMKPIVLIPLCIAFVTHFAGEASGEKGLASFYWHGQMTASGEKFNPNAMTCAHKTRPFGQFVTVTWGDKSIVCRINDRGPYIKGRVIDLSLAAARALGMTGRGVVPVEVTD